MLNELNVGAVRSTTTEYSVVSESRSSESVAVNCIVVVPSEKSVSVSDQFSSPSAVVVALE